MATDDGKLGSGGFRSQRGKRFGTLEKVFDGVWWAWGTTRFFAGMTFPRNMFVFEEPGGLVVVHPVLLPDAEQAKLEALGAVKHILRLGAFHGMDDPLYVERYAPTVWAPPGVKQPSGVKTDRELVPGAELPLSGAKLFAYERSRSPETAVILERHGGILCTCDSVQSWETTFGCSPLGAVLARVMGFRGRVCIGPGWKKMCEPKDDAGFGPDFRRLLEHGFDHLLSGHGVPVRGGAKRDLQERVDAAYA